MDCTVMVSNLVAHATAEWRNAESRVGGIPPAAAGPNPANVRAPSFKRARPNSLAAVETWRDEIESDPAWRGASGDGASEAALSTWARHICGNVLPPKSHGYWRTVDSSLWAMTEVAA